MPKKRPSAAEAKRMRAQLLLERAIPKPVSPAVDAYLSRYRAVDATEVEWEAIGDVVRRFVSDAAFSDMEAVKKHCVATSAYVLWRHREHLSVAADARDGWRVTAFEERLPKPAPWPRKPGESWA